MYRANSLAVGPLRLPPLLPSDPRSDNPTNFILYSAVLFPQELWFIYNVHFTLHSMKHCTVWIGYCIIFSIHCTVYFIKCILFSNLFTVDFVHCSFGQTGYTQILGCRVWRRIPYMVYLPNSRLQRYSIPTVLYLLFSLQIILSSRRSNTLPTVIHC